MSAETVYAFGRENDFNYVSEDIREHVIEHSSWGPRNCRVSPPMVASSGSQMFSQACQARERAREGCGHVAPLFIPATLAFRIRTLSLWPHP